MASIGGERIQKHARRVKKYVGGVLKAYLKLASPPNRGNMRGPWKQQMIYVEALKTGQGTLQSRDYLAMNYGSVVC